jgi:acyl-CoA dehydrogenase
MPSRAPRASRGHERLEAEIRRIGLEIAQPLASEIDRDARFPHEAVAELKKAKALGAGIPTDLGGLGCGITELATLCRLLGRSCASTAMVLAMHYIEVACLVRHGMSSSWIRGYLAEVAERQLLIASATSEVGVGGDLRTSQCAVQADADGFRLEKIAAAVSYGEEADDVLVTARRSPAAAGNDQVLLLLRRSDYALERRGTWQTLGMRGTCSPAFRLTGHGRLDQILPAPFADIASSTMVPFSHILWASVWVGLASDTVERARSFVREQARQRPGVVPPTAARLGELCATFQAMRAGVQDAIAEHRDLLDATDGGQAVPGLGVAVRMNGLKLTASRQLVEVVQQALLVCGMAGYANDSNFALGRHLRDAYSAPLMIGNDRILATNAALLLVSKSDA